MKIRSLPGLEIPGKIGDNVVEHGRVNVRLARWHSDLFVCRPTVSPAKEEAETSAESALADEVVSTVESTITATLGELTVVNNDDGHDDAKSRIRYYKAHSPRRVQRSSRVPDARTVS